VSNELGAGHPKSASFSVLVVTSCSFIISVIAAIIVMMFRDSISYIFTEGEVVAKAASDLSPFLAVTIILNGVQPVLSGKFQTQQALTYQSLYKRRNSLLFFSVIVLELKPLLLPLVIATNVSLRKKKNLNFMFS
jgi:Na+-driven multidrug efflux pump